MYQHLSLLYNPVEIDVLVFTLVMSDKLANPIPNLLAFRDALYFLGDFISVFRTDSHGLDLLSFVVFAPTGHRDITDR